MERIFIGTLHEHVGKKISIAGWVNRRRDHGKLIFLDVRDRSGIVQVVALPEHSEVLRLANTLRPEWVIQLEGVVNKRPDKMVNSGELNGDIEIEITTLTVLSQAIELPFDKDATVNLDTALDYRPLTIRGERERAIFRVQHEILRAYREALTQKGFSEFEAPKIVGGDAEGGAHVFKVEYFNDRDAYLATSPQLYKQIMVGSLERVFAIGNVFRAEKHSTSRHLNEYTSLDAELGFIEDHHDVMNTLTTTLEFMCGHLRETCIQEFTILGAELPHVLKTIPHVTLREAQVLITKETGEDCTAEKDLAPEHERWLSEYAQRKHGSDFIFVTHFPLEKTAFYAFEDPDNPGYARYFDLLFRGVEIVSGGQRIHNPEQLRARMMQKGLDPKQFAFYLQAFDYGLPPHGGWGMGLERLTQKFLNLENVKEATLFPRDMNRIDSLLNP
jgi:nondiscriminating aspartyl-tRNA synthetase